MAKTGRKANELLGVDDLLCFALYSANHAMNRVYKPLLDTLSLTYPQYLALTVLWQDDDLTVSQMGSRLFLESNTLTPLLKRLETLGYVSRRRDPDDERQVRVTLTKKGKALRKAASPISRCIFEATALDEKGILRLKKQVSALRDNLTQSAAAQT